MIPLVGVISLFCFVLGWMTRSYASVVAGAAIWAVVLGGVEVGAWGCCAEDDSGQTYILTSAISALAAATGAYLARLFDLPPGRGSRRSRSDST